MKTYLAITFSLLITSWQYPFQESKVYQEAIIYFNNGNIVYGELLVYKKNALHNERLYSFKNGMEEIKYKFKEIDSILLGKKMYTKITLPNTPGLKGKSETISRGDLKPTVIFATKVVEGKFDLYTSYWIYDKGHELDPDKINYLANNYYIWLNDKYSCIHNPRVSSITLSTSHTIDVIDTPSKKEHKYVLNKLKEFYPNCSALDIKEEYWPIRYEDIPELVTMANKSCSSSPTDITRDPSY